MKTQRIKSSACIRHILIYYQEQINSEYEVSFESRDGSLMTEGKGLLMETIRIAVSVALGDLNGNLALYLPAMQLRSYLISL